MIRMSLAVSAVLALFGGYVGAQTSEEVLIGRRSFIDIGPPFEFYEIFVLLPARNGTSIKRINLTPPGDICTTTATVEFASASLSESIPELLGPKDPCGIPEKDLRSEQKRCKKCLVFSGADVTMEMQCSGQRRHIRMDILDRDMFDRHSKTPEHTSWTMALLGRLDKALGGNVMDRPMMNLSPGAHTVPELPDVSNGRFDTLFETGSFKPSGLYRQAQARPRTPTVALLASSPISPTESPLPGYPPIARAARLGGKVDAVVEIGAGGRPSRVTVTSGHPLMRKTVETAVSRWVFPPEAAGRETTVSFEFDLNCPASKP